MSYYFKILDENTEVIVLCLDYIPAVNRFIYSFLCIAILSILLYLNLSPFLIPFAGFIIILVVLFNFLTPYSNKMIIDGEEKKLYLVKDYIHQSKEEIFSFNEVKELTIIESKISQQRGSTINVYPLTLSIGMKTFEFGPYRYFSIAKEKADIINNIILFDKFEEDEYKGYFHASWDIETIKKFMDSKLENIKITEKVTYSSKKTYYLPNTDILVFNEVKPEDQNAFEQLRNSINNKAKHIITILNSLLPTFEANDMISTELYEYFKKNSWQISDIIENFKIKVSVGCKNYRSIGEKVSMAIDEEELLSKTDMAMTEWIEDTGKDISFLININ